MCPRRGSRLNLGFHRPRAFNLSRRLRLRGEDFTGAAPVMDGGACIKFGMAIQLTWKYTVGRGQSGFSALNGPDDTCPGLWVLVYSY